MGKWKKIKARTEHSCLCCNESIKQKEECWTETEWEQGAFPHPTYYCEDCGPVIKEGLSFNEARKRKIGFKCDECRQKFSSDQLDEFTENYESKLLCASCLSKKKKSP